MKRIFITLAAMFLAMPVAVQAQFDFTTNNGAITITGYDGGGGNVVIPASINGYPVTTIGDYAFSESSLSGITIPDSVTNIGDYAFGNCDNLGSVIIPDSVTTIGEGVFFDCENLTSVNISTNVTNISDGAFYQCYRLSGVNIPNNVTRIGEGAFLSCYGLTSVNIPDKVASIGGGAFDSCPLASIIIPAGITNIGGGAFNECGFLTAVYFLGNAPPDNGSAFEFSAATIYYRPGTMGWGATFGSAPTAPWYTSVTLFVCATNSDTITITDYTGNDSIVYIPDTINGLPVTSIGPGAFANCYSLTNVTISHSVTNISADAFAGCINLTTVYFFGNAPPDDGTVFNGLPLTVYYPWNAVGWGVNFGGAPTAIWYPWFAYTTNDDNTINITGYTGVNTSMIIPGTFYGLTVTTVRTLAFYYNTRLTSVIIPNGVISIGDYAFQGCSSLTNVLIPDSVTSIGNSTFSGTSLRSVTIPENTTSIGDYAFYGCSSLINVNIGTCITNIGVYAFANCSSLTASYFAGNAPPDDGTVFYGSPTVVYYLPGTTGWGATFDGVPTALWNPTLQTTDGSFGVKNNQFGFNLTGTTNIPVRLEAATTLNQSSWSPLFIGTLTNGSLYFTDLNWTNYPTRFYRVRSP